MKRTLSWIAPAMLVAVAMVLGTCERSVAQEGGEASAGAETGASADQSAADQSTSDTGQSNAGQSDTSGQSDTQTNTSTADTNSSANVDTQTSTSQDGATSEQSATSSSDTDAAAQTDVDASADQSQTRSRQREQARQTDRARSDATTDFDARARGRADLDADSDARTRTDLDTRGRADIDARSRTDLDRRSRADLDSRDRADFDRNRRDFRDGRRQANFRGDRRQRDFAAGIRFGRATDRGLVIDTIERDSFFFDSGLRRGDIIVSIGGRPIHHHDDFHHWIVAQPGRRVPVVILRDGQRETVYVTYHDDVQFQDDAYARTEQSGPGYLGVTFDAGIRNAAVLANVHPGSPAEEAGLQPDDDILAINGQEVRSFQEALDMIRTMQAGEQVEIVFARQIEPRGRPMEEQTTAVLAARPEPQQRVNTRREVRVYRGGPEYYAEPIDQRFEERRTIRSDEDRRLLDRDRDDDRRGDDDRGLLERVFD